METKQIPLVMRCPGENCNNISVITCWSHSSCSKQVFLKGNGHIVCNGCSDHPFTDWRFACKDHVGDYRRPDFMAIGNALGAAMGAIKAHFTNAKEALEFLALVQKKILEESYDFK